MNKNKYLIFIFLGLFSVACLLAVIELALRKQKVETIQAVAEGTITTENLTLLERMYEDVDSDGKDESVELYTSAQRGPDGFMEWDDGQRWLLLVRKEGEIFPLFNDYVQLGQIEFWIGIFNKSRIISPDTGDLERHIYVMHTRYIQLADYYWDQKKRCFNKKIVFEPPNWWDARSSFRYNCYDPSLIERLRSD